MSKIFIKNRIDGKVVDDGIYNKCSCYCYLKVMIKKPDSKKKKQIKSLEKGLNIENSNVGIVLYKDNSKYWL